MLCLQWLNAGLVYCMDYLEKNIDWLHAKLKPLIKGTASDNVHTH